MKKTVKKAMMLLLAAALLVTPLVLSAFAEVKAQEGITFTHLGSYLMERGFDKIPRTIEAEILLPKDHKGDAGVIFSNRNAADKDLYIDLSVEKGGNPTLKYIDDSGIAYSYRFKNVNLCTGNWLHLCVVIDGARGEVRCYVDGTFKAAMNSDSSEKPFSDCAFDGAEKPFSVGGDATENNPNYFLGAIKSLAAFDAVRSEREISADAASDVDSGDTSLLCKYNMEGLMAGEGANDLSVNQNDLSCTLKWFEANVGAYTKNFDFSIALVGDIQTVTFYAARDGGQSSEYQKTLSGIFRWIVDSKEEKKIQYAIGLGDITEMGEDWGHKNNNEEGETAVGDAEWAIAKDAISQMDGIVPYSLVRGSGHDGVERFNEWFSGHKGYTENIAGYYQEGRIENVYHTFEVGETKYMIFSLNFGAKDDVLAWANEVVAAHPDHRVIVSTHAYLDIDGTTLDHGEDSAASASYYDPTNNDGDAIWKGFVSKHENIFLVVSGHMPTEEIVMKQREGEKGNTVTEMLIDPQKIDKEYKGGTGMVAMLYFSGDDVFVEYYSTAHGVYKPLKSFNVNHKHEYKPLVIAPTCDHYGYTVNECLCGEYYRTDLTPRLEHVYDSDTDVDCNLCGKPRRIEDLENKTESSEEENDSVTDGSGVDTSPADGSQKSFRVMDMTAVLWIVAAAAGGILVIGVCFLLLKRKRRK